MEHRSTKPVDEGSNPSQCIMNAGDCIYDDCTRSSTAELPALNRVAAGSSPAGCTVRRERRTVRQRKGESEDSMERLISLFREPDGDGGYVSPDAPRPAAAAAEVVQAELKVLNDEPIYFRQLLEYLRQQKAAQEKEKRS